jgi:hypothetical protein
LGGKRIPETLQQMEQEQLRNLTGEYAACNVTTAAQRKRRFYRIW